MRPAPVSARTTPLAQPRRILPPPVSISTGPEFPELDVAAAGGDLELAAALTCTSMLPPPASSVAPWPGHKHDVSAAGGGVYLPLALAILDPAPAGFEVQVAVHGPDFDAVAASFRGHGTADVVEVHLAAAAFRFHPARDSVDGHVAAVGFNLCQFEIARDVDDEFTGTEVMPSPCQSPSMRAVAPWA